MEKLSSLLIGNAEHRLRLITRRGSWFTIFTKTHYKITYFIKNIWKKRTQINPRSVKQRHSNTHNTIIYSTNKMFSNFPTTTTNAKFARSNASFSHRVSERTENKNNSLCTRPEIRKTFFPSDHIRLRLNAVCPAPALSRLPTEKENLRTHPPIPRITDKINILNWIK